MAHEPELLDIKQAAALLQVSEASLRRWTNAGRLACFRVGGRRERRFRRADLMAFLESHPFAAGAAGRGAPPPHPGGGPPLRPFVGGPPPPPPAARLPPPRGPAAGGPLLLA